MVNLDETVETMYPLMEPALENIADQVVEKQTTEANYIQCGLPVYVSGIVERD